MWHPPPSRTKDERRSVHPPWRTKACETLANFEPRHWWQAASRQASRRPASAPAADKPRARGWCRNGLTSKLDLSAPLPHIVQRPARLVLTPTSNVRKPSEGRTRCPRRATLTDRYEPGVRRWARRRAGLCPMQDLSLQIAFSCVPYHRVTYPRAKGSLGSSTNTDIADPRRSSSVDRNDANRVQPFPRMGVEMNVQDNKLENVKVVYVASSRGDAALNVLWLLVAIAAAAAMGAAATLA